MKDRMDLSPTARDFRIDPKKFTAEDKGVPIRQLTKDVINEVRMANRVNGTINIGRRMMGSDFTSG